MSILDIQDQFAINLMHESTLIVGLPCEKQPLVSIMIPTFKRPELLHKAIYSALTQNSDICFEVVVVDNDSDSEGAVVIDELVRGFADTRLRLFRNAQNLGMFGNWNRCIELARGKWVSILNDDDFLQFDFLQSAMSQIADNEEINLLFAKCVFLDERGSSIKKKLSNIKQELKKINYGLLQRRLTRLSNEDLFLDAPFSSLTTLFKRAGAIEIGGFKAHEFPSSDYVFFCMYHLRFGSHQLNRYLGHYRIHQSETAKPSTGEGFVTKNLELRRHMQTYIGRPAWLMSLYAKMHALKTMREYKKFWNVELDEIRIRRENNLPHIPGKFFYMLVRYALRIAFFFNQKNQMPRGLK